MCPVHPLMYPMYCKKNVYVGRDGKLIASDPSRLGLLQSGVMFATAFCSTGSSTLSSYVCINLDGSDEFSSTGLS